MTKLFKALTIITTLACLTMVLGACAIRGDKALQPAQTAPEEGKSLQAEKEVEIKAVYLTPVEGGQLSTNDLKKYPQVVIVHSQADLENIVSQKMAIWIDKKSAENVNKAWLNSKPQKYYSVILLGYNNALYSFREILNLGQIHGPYVDWSKQKVEPGYSAWMIKEETESSLSAFMKGYDNTPNVENVLHLCNQLLEEKEITAAEK